MAKKLDGDSYVVYCHVNKVNGKKYIGITKRTVDIRWRKGKGYYNSPHFYSAIGKYGWDGFSHIILFYDISRKDAETIEKYLIKVYKTMDRDYGYNKSPGGSGGNNKPVKRVYKYDLDGNFICSYKSGADAERMNGICRGRISSCCCNRTKSIGGYVYTYLEGGVGKYTDERYVSVCMLDQHGNLVKIFKNMQDAALFVNARTSDISAAANGRQRSCRGYFWKKQSDFYEVNL